MSQWFLQVRTNSSTEKGGIKQQPVSTRSPWACSSRNVEIWQVRWIDQIQYPMIVVASLSAVPQSCRIPLLVNIQVLRVEMIPTHTHTPSPSPWDPSRVVVEPSTKFFKQDMTWHHMYQGEPKCCSNHPSPRKQDAEEENTRGTPEHLYSSNKPSRNTADDHTHPNKSTGKQQAKNATASKARPTDCRGTAAKQRPTHGHSTFRLRFPLQTKTSNQQLQEEQLVQTNMTGIIRSWQMQASWSGSRPISRP